MAVIARRSLPKPSRFELLDCFVGTCNDGVGCIGAVGWSVLFRTHRREQDHIANRRRVGQQHDQAVDADTAATGRRQAVFEGADEVGVVIHRFFVTGILGFHLFLEAGGLIFGVVQLGEAVGDFATDDEQFETLGDFRVVVGGAGQRRDFNRVVDDEGRFPALGFGTGFEQLQLQAAQTARLDLLAEGIDLGLEEVGVGQLFVGKGRLFALDRLADGQTMEGLERSSSRP